MATAKMDYKKEYKDLYLPKRKPSVIDVPAIGFIMVDGKGAPEGDEYQSAMQALYSLSFTIGSRTATSTTSCRRSRGFGMEPKGRLNRISGTNGCGLP